MATKPVTVGVDGSEERLAAGTAGSLSRPAGAAG